MLEETKGVLPLWLSPVQISIIPVNFDVHGGYCDEIKDKLLENNLRVEIDTRDEKLSYKMREAQKKKIPYILVIGDKEKEANMVNYREHGSKTTTSISVDDFINKLKIQIQNHK